MITTLTEIDQHHLDRAAGLLDAAGRTSTNGSIAIRCLLAAELLTAAGAEPEPNTEIGEGDRATLGEALYLLGSLPIDLLSDDRLLDAMHHALLAHAATG